MDDNICPEVTTREFFYFVKVYEAIQAHPGKSLRKIAEELRAYPTNLSDAIQKLEQHLKLEETLFYKEERKPYVNTKQGKKLYPKIRKILDDIHELSSNNQENIKIGVIQTLNSLVTSFGFSCEELPSHKIKEGMKNGIIQLGIYLSNASESEFLLSSKMKSQLIYKDAWKLRLVVPLNHKSFDSETATLKQLEQANKSGKIKLTLMTNEYKTKTDFDKKCKEKGIHLEYKTNTNLHSLLIFLDTPQNLDHVTVMPNLLQWFHPTSYVKFLPFQQDDEVKNDIVLLYPSQGEKNYLDVIKPLVKKIKDAILSKLEAENITI